MMNIIKPITAFDTQTTMVRRAITAFNVENFIVFNIVGKLTTHATIRTNRFNLTVRFHHAHFIGRHQCTGWASLHTFATGDAGAFPHRVVKIKDNFGVAAAHCQTNYIVILFITTGTNTTGTLDTGIHIDGNTGMRKIRSNLFARLKSWRTDFKFTCPVIEFGMQGMRLFGNIRFEQFQYHFLRMQSTFAIGLHFHIIAGITAA